MDDDRAFEMMRRFDDLMFLAEPIYRRGVSSKELEPGLALETIRVFALIEIGHDLKRIADALERRS